MEIRELSYFQQFTCLASECPETCCRGWIIPLDEEDERRLKAQKGILGLKLFLATRGWLANNFNPSSEVCPFLNREGLCSMQLKKGHDILPEACREYPRFYRNYGLWEEQYIDLSCIAGAKLWFDHYNDLKIIKREGDPVSGKDSTNEDEEYLLALDHCREEMIGALFGVKTTEDLLAVFSAIDLHAKKLQETGLRANGEKELLKALATFGQTREEIGNKLLKNGADNTSGNKTDTESTESRDGLCQPVSGIKIFPLNAKTIGKIMKTHLFSERLKTANPNLHTLCKLYYDYGSRRFEREWTRSALDFLKRNERYVPYYASLYAFYLYQHFLRCYEDYSFIRNVRTGFIHVNMKFLFDVLWERSNGKITDDVFVHGLAVYNRRAYFNAQILDEMYAALDF